MSTPDTPGPVDPAFLGVDDELAQDGEPTPPSPDVHAAPDSPLASIRERRAAVVLVFDLEVPRLDPPVYVRYRVVAQRRVEEIGERVGKQRGKDKTVVFNATVLADACEGIFEVIEGQKVSVDPEDRDGEWPKFDKRLAELLGVRAGKASEVVRALYATDWDIISTAQKLVELSGRAGDQLELDDDPGN